MNDDELELDLIDSGVHCGYLMAIDGMAEDDQFDRFVIMRCVACGYRGFLDYSKVAW